MVPSSRMFVRDRDIRRTKKISHDTIGAMQFVGQFTTRTYFLFALFILSVFALTLLLMGQVPWCKCGYVKFWHGVTFSSENSQHISDWYTFSHIIHGFGFYFLFWLVGRRWPLGVRLLGAIFLESAWEIF